MPRWGRARPQGGERAAHGESVDLDAGEASCADVVGDREAESGSVTLRRHGEGDRGSRALQDGIEEIRHAA